ncbi:GNAT family N-acetyltransferase [Pseudothauera rhizosphaerae]|uniref:GNAT family N-acetyltransferase n=1 Tax=Pseudothauera rhizosphaerae TaxID=2565932 RepID=A0A4S4AIQ4_9RHOO|nr:GNAT family N-acetyltransferase [Pseudothauera rhizosphaerae]THF59246.1 GNAT family N-acetyltransferase [Pseudothauera rhizosphaerae]
MTLTIRPATRDDLAAVIALYESSGIDAPGANDLAAARGHWAQMQRAGAQVLLAEHEGRAVGTLTLFILPLLGHALAPQALVEDVAVDPAAQGQGVGRALMNHAMGVARGRGCYKLALTSNVKRERAHGFYDSLGFTRHGISFVVPLDDRQEARP